MPSYKLIYFNAMGRAELTRWLFAYGNIPYTDERIEKADWPERKKELPYPKVPILMVDDKPMPQSLAIARYVAKEVGLVPQDNLKAAYCDAMADTVAEIMGSLYSILMSSKDEEEKRKELREEFYPKVLEPMLTRVNKRLGDNEWFIGDQISWCDLIIAQAFGRIQKQKPEVIAKFPAVAAHISKVEEIPQIKAWLAKRPETQF